MSNQTTNILKDYRKNLGNQGRLGAYMNTVIADLEIDGKGQYFRELFEKYDVEMESFLETVISQVKEETERRIAQKIYDKWNNSQDAEISFGDWLKNYLLIKSQSEDSSKS